MVNDSNLRTQRTLRSPVCGVPTLHHFCIRKNGCDVLACSACGVGRADTTNFDPAAYYTDAYFEGRQANDSQEDGQGEETRASVGKESLSPSARATKLSSGSGLGMWRAA
jgi:transcription elongation factor Elf1